MLLRYEVHTRYEDTGLWGTIRTVPVDSKGPDGETRDWLSARINAVAQAKAAQGQFSDLRVVAIQQAASKREYLRLVWENGVWKDNHMTVHHRELANA